MLTMPFGDMYIYIYTYIHGAGSFNALFRNFLNKSWFFLCFYWFFEETGLSGFPDCLSGFPDCYWAFPIAYWAFPIAYWAFSEIYWAFSAMDWAFPITYWCLMVHGSRLKAQGSWLMAKGGQGRLMAHGQGPARPWGPRGARARTRTGSAPPGRPLAKP